MIAQSILTFLVCLVIGLVVAKPITDALVREARDHRIIKKMADEQGYSYGFMYARIKMAQARNAGKLSDEAYERRVNFIFQRYPEDAEKFIASLEEQEVAQ